VVHHDAVLHAGDVPQSGDIAIADANVGVVKAHPLRPGIRIPTLVEALDAIGSRAMVFIEIKARNIEPLVVRCIRESTAECAVHSFDHRIVVNVKKIFPAIRCGVLQVARHVNPVASLESTRAEDLWQHVDYIDTELMERAHTIGARVIAWTANDARQWSSLGALGIDGICTDRIAELGAAGQPAH
jgi:glycerophosphoryl diester phosphodiesterase